jgi:hypothetical protein
MIGIKKRRIRMKKSNLVVLLLVVVVTGAGVLFAQVNAARQGSQPYTPTRLEWLAVALNAADRTDPSPDKLYELFYMQNELEDAIIINVFYHPAVNREIMNADIIGAQKVIKAYIEAYGWDWVRIRENVQMKQSK